MVFTDCVVQHTEREKERLFLPFISYFLVISELKIFRLQPACEIGYFFLNEAASFSNLKLSQTLFHLSLLAIANF